jgi:hypothetical protein
MPTTASAGRRKISQGKMSLTHKMEQQSALTKTTQYSHLWRVNTDGSMHQLQHSYGEDDNKDMN